MLASDSASIEETVNNQIIKPLFENLGYTGEQPRFRFKLKGVSELIEMANVLKTISEAGYEAEEATLSEKFGFKITKKESIEEVQNVD